MENLKCPECGSISIMEIVKAHSHKGICRECWHKDDIDQFAVEDEQERADLMHRYYSYE